jgi:hypothetical protein
VTANSVSAGWGSDLKVAAVAAMAPLLAGSAVLLGYLWLGGFGVVLGIGGAIAWAVWWYRRESAFFPRDIQTAPLVITTVVTFGLVFLSLVTAA